MEYAYSKGADDREKVEVLNCFTQSKMDFKELGFCLLESKNQYHVTLLLPEGWHTKTDPDHEGVVFFCDEKGRKRGSFSEDYYHGYAVRLFCRYRLDFVACPAPDKLGGDFGELRLLDWNNKVIKTFGQFWYYSRDYETSYREAEEYLQEFFPNYDDPLAYWD